MIEVVAPGPLCTVQDLGRPGLAYLGVGRSGAADRPALRLANRLVGNAEDAAGLEATLGSLTLRFDAAGLIAVAGAPTEVSVGGRAGGMNAPLSVPAGGTVELAAPAAGVRCYLAVRGGIAVEPVLGSRSTDLLAGLGPPRLAAGMRLPVGAEVLGFPAVDLAPVSPLPDVVVLRALLGPRDDWFTPQARDDLGRHTYEVSPASDRVGLRLHGPALERGRSDELPSEGMVEGALQVTPDGMPVLLLADHPVTGGYPVIAVVDTDDVHLAAQARPGQQVRFRLAPR
ncbi:MAG: biotin-dependent carboxyltransferase family protein [Actinomycetota bacterium]|nr:biotin-dependent carboxyltransferase family protein [Actinomycetota bacterium]